MWVKFLLSTPLNGSINLIVLSFDEVNIRLSLLFQVAEVINAVCCDENDLI